MTGNDSSPPHQLGDPSNFSPSSLARIFHFKMKGNGQVWYSNSGDTDSPFTYA